VSNRIGVTLASHHCAGSVDTGFVALGSLKVAVLGIVQGVSELLPISSTAHMRAIPAFLGWPDPGSAFSAAMQLAALFAVLSYFHSDIREMSWGCFHALRARQWNAPALRLGASVVLATTPIALAGAALSGVLNRCHSPMRSALLIGIASVLMAVLMGFSEWWAKHRRTSDQLRYRDAFAIGLAQVGALIPGVSRSGSTLAAAMLMGFRREDAARVSFLLGIPAIALAGLHELWVLRQNGLPSHGWLLLAVGLVTSGLSSFAAVWGLMRFLERHSTWPLIVYRAGFGLILVIGASLNWIQ
jgi:undecaprenyl-diphosphatase